MSIFKPTSILAVVGAMLFLIALYLFLTHASSGAQILGSLASGAVSITGALQGRSVNASTGQVS